MGWKELVELRGRNGGRMLPGLVMRRGCAGPEAANLKRLPIGAGQYMNLAFSPSQILKIRLTIWKSKGRHIDQSESRCSC